MAARFCQPTLKPLSAQTLRQTGSAPVDFVPECSDSRDRCDSLAGMQRAKATIVLLALLAVPLALLARGMACESSSGPMICCMLHGSHHGNQQMMCHCAGKSSSHIPDFGLIAPLPPTEPEAFAAIAAPSSLREPMYSQSQPSLPGFVSVPFEPPRA